MTLTAPIKRLRPNLSRGERLRLWGMAAVIVALLVVGSALVIAASVHHYHLSRTELFGVGTGVLALTLGMRHAFDADHISAIDNTTRKLMAEGKRPLSVGFFFSLGHSSVVFVLAVALTVGVRALGGQLRDGGSGLHHVTSVVGTSVSGVFLYLLALLNLAVLLSILRAFRDLRSGRYDKGELDRRLDQRGLMNRVLGPVARQVDTPWKMYPVGVLFGLGFDTATEVALLVLSGSAVAGGLPFWAVLSLPLLFAGGMCLFDTLDGCFMNFAYGWSLSRPVRKIYYNLVVTALSVVVALGIGTVEILGLVGNEFGLRGSFWHAMGSFNINAAGFFLVGLFVLTWVVALVAWRVGRFDTRWEPGLAPSVAED